MPIWLELLALMLVAYAAGLALGWMAWGRAEGLNEEAGPNDRESGE
jgi:hypothetical protein